MSRWSRRALLAAASGGAGLKMPAIQRTPRIDGVPKRHTPFDDKLAIKPLFHAMAAAFRAAPPRTRANITGQVA